MEKWKVWSLLRASLCVMSMCAYRAGSAGMQALAVRAASSGRLNSCEVGAPQLAAAQALKVLRCQLEMA